MRESEDKNACSQVRHNECVGVNLTKRYIDYDRIAPTYDEWDNCPSLNPAQQIAYGLTKC